MFILTVTNDSALIGFFVEWCGVMHYIDAVRIFTVGVMRIVALFNDKVTDVMSYDGTSKTYAVSKDHPLDYWAIAMEIVTFEISYNQYENLHSIVERRAEDIEEEDPVAEDEENMEFEDDDSDFDF